MIRNVQQPAVAQGVACAAAVNEWKRSVAWRGGDESSGAEPFLEEDYHLSGYGSSSSGSRKEAMPSKKRKREERPTIHPKNKYADKPPDFALLASLYPSLEPFVFFPRDGRPRIDWTDFNATRELTRILLLHDHALNWWIPDGQLCPTVPNRSNYIHWIEDLLSSGIVPKIHRDSDGIRGFDIGTGANCIYPLLGASLKGWSFVGSDMTEAAMEWAEKNVKSNPHVSELIEIRRVMSSPCTVHTRDQESPDGLLGFDGSIVDVAEASSEAGCPPKSSSLWPPEDGETGYNGPPVLVGVVLEGEKFDFCMCNPPFFESMEEAGLNPKTSCGGTPEEMVCSGGEKAFITRIINDSVVLRHSFRWFTSMVGRKVNLKFLISKLREANATIVKTTEFVQGQTCRWGLAWSFVPPVKKIIKQNIVMKSNLSFTLEGLQRQCGAVNVLQSVDSFFRAYGAFLNLNSSAFTVDITLSTDQCKAVLKDFIHVGGDAHQNKQQDSPANISFRVSVFQQIPGTLLLKGSLQNKNSTISELFPPIFQALEESLREEFCRGKGRQ